MFLLLLKQAQVMGDQNPYENVSRATSHVRVALGLTVMWRVPV